MVENITRLDAAPLPVKADVNKAAICENHLYLRYSWIRALK